MIDCVVSYHMNPGTCGVARFNMVLAQQLGVPMLSVFDEQVLEFREPLLSIKLEEFAPARLVDLDRTLDTMFSQQAVRLFLHTFANTSLERDMLRRAARVYCGNPEIQALVARHRSDAEALWCPGVILSQERFEPAEIKVFSFGMAHKIRAEYYKKLQELLEATGKTYSLYISTALHENTSFDESFDGTFDELRAIFGDRLYFVGFLSDTAVYNYLLDCTYFAAFFGSGVRSNNTSVNAAMASGAVVITNLDSLSPPALEHGSNVLDIEALTVLPTDAETLGQISRTAEDTARRELGWEALVSAIGSLETSAVVSRPA